jgi:hypothetical protein
MEMTKVASSVIAAVGYDHTTQRMQIRFKEGRTYTFCRVPSKVFEGLVAASSKGAYFDRYIKGHFSC